MGRAAYLCNREKEPRPAGTSHRRRTSHSRRPVSAKVESGSIRRWRGWLRRLLADAPPADAGPSAHDRRLHAIAAISAALTRARDLETAARPLVEQVQALLGVEFAAVSVVDAEAAEARGVFARIGAEDA